MNPRKLMARLHASTVNLAGGHGGVPELTPCDIAAALAFVSDPVAREVFCAIHWPEGARLAREDVLSKFLSHLLTEYCQRVQRLTVARLEQHMAESTFALKATQTPIERKILVGLRSEIAVARARNWPGDPVVYPRICEAVIAELSGADRCGLCRGRGAVIRDGLATICAGCGGAGIETATDLWRARAIGKAGSYTLKDGDRRDDASGYRRTWAPVYEWARELAAAAEASAARDIAAALRREVDAEPA